MVRCCTDGHHPLGGGFSCSFCLIFALSLFSLPTIATAKPLLKVVSTTTCHSNVSLTCAPQPSVSWRPPLMHPRTLTLRAFYPRFQGLEERGLHSHEIACSSPACFCLLQLARPPLPSTTPALVVSSFFICSRRLSCCPPLICEQYPLTFSSQTHLKLVSPIYIIYHDTSTSKTDICDKELGFFTT